MLSICKNYIVNVQQYSQNLYFPTLIYIYIYIYINQSFYSGLSSLLSGSSSILCNNARKEFLIIFLISLVFIALLFRFVIVLPPFFLIVCVFPTLSIVVHFLIYHLCSEFILILFMLPIHFLFLQYVSLFCCFSALHIVELDDLREKDHLCSWWQ